MARAAGGRETQARDHGVPRNLRCKRSHSHVTNRFAGLGFFAISPEVFHRTVPPKWETNYTDFVGAMPHMQAVKEASFESDVKATNNRLQSNTQDIDKIACLGNCMGVRKY